MAKYWLKSDTSAGAAPNATISVQVTVPDVKQDMYVGALTLEQAVEVLKYSLHKEDAFEADVLTKVIEDATAAGLIEVQKEETAKKK